MIVVPEPEKPSQTMAPGSLQRVRISDRSLVGLGLTVMVGVKVDGHRDQNATAIQQAFLAMPEVVTCHLISGEADFLLEVVVTDLQAYERFLLGRLLKLPMIKDIRSNFVIRTVKDKAPLPLDHLRGKADL